MSFLLDTDTCSAHIRRPTSVAHRFLQHSGRLYLSTVSLAELYAWAYRTGAAQRLAAGIRELIQDVEILPFDSDCAAVFGSLRPKLTTIGIAVPPMDLLIATTALAHDLTLVTHNVADFANIPDLRVVDWLAS